MRVGVAASVITSSAQIDAGVIVDSDVNAAAAIQSSKVNLSAIDQHVIPASTANYTHGDGTHKWLEGYFVKLAYDYDITTVKPWADDLLDLGDSTHNYRKIFTNDLGGAAGTLLYAGLALP